MTVMCDLSQDLVEEILSRVLTTSLGAVRSTCKLWNALSKDRFICKVEPKHQFLGLMIVNHRLCSMRFNLHEILNEGGEELIDISKYQVNVSQVLYCNGLLLCVTSGNMSRLVVWNPYLGQTRSIQPKTITVSNERIMYAFGYDKNMNHKILRLFYHNQGSYEIYDFKSSSWKVFNVTLNWDIDFYMPSASVDGNTYFWAMDLEGYDSSEDEDEGENFDILIYFDFTEERFEKYHPLPFKPDSNNNVSLSSVKEKKLAVLNQYYGTSVINIWIAAKIESNAVLWIPFLQVDMKLDFDEFDDEFDVEYDSFFIDEEKQVAVIFYLHDHKTAFIIAENRYLKKVDLGEDVALTGGPIIVSSSYVPNLVQINQIVGCKRRKRRGRRGKRKRGRGSKRTRFNNYQPKGN